MDLDLKNRLSPPAKLFIEDQPVLESKELPSHLRYAFLGSGDTLPVIVAADLGEQHVEALISALKRFAECMPNTRSLGQPLLPINPEPHRIGRMDAQREIERRAAQQEQARLAALAAAQVHQQNIDNPGRATNLNDEDLGDNELLNPRRAYEVAAPVNRRDRQARMRPGR
ncbi:hypothetical protein CQW23_18450 [Capsicum baccatum]|uniref:Uncharacterized protein n=1 Tax=Capsicum baccatum TaxID=33114 RepID=A0A2G2W2Y3_CAPBA|nr:hypothetical protein CQW23_18450 [Capsicum baccatum]